MKRIDMNQQNLNNKTSNHKIEKHKNSDLNISPQKNPKSPQKTSNHNNSYNKSEYESKKSK